MTLRELMADISDVLDNPECVIDDVTYSLLPLCAELRHATTTDTTWALGGNDYTLRELITSAYCYYADWMRTDDDEQMMHALRNVLPCTPAQAMTSRGSYVYLLLQDTPE